MNETRPDGDGTYRGVIYAVDTTHLNFCVEAPDGTRTIVEPELWQPDNYMAWLRCRATVHGKGIQAAGLPLVMRATVEREVTDVEAALLELYHASTAVEGQDSDWLSAIGKSHDVLERYGLLGKARERGKGR